MKKAWQHAFAKTSKSVETPPGRPASAVLGGPARQTLVKVALVGDSQVGKTSLMERFCEGTFDETQLHTQGVNFMERCISLEAQEITFSIWDIGGHTDSESMLPLVCNDAAALLLIFDLTRPETLDAIRDWHRKARALNKCAMPFLVGCKYDLLLEQPVEEHLHMLSVVRSFASAIDAPLIFCAPSVPINVSNVFKVILIRLFGLAPTVPIMSQPGEPLILYEQRHPASGSSDTATGSAQRSLPAVSASANVSTAKSPLVSQASAESMAAASNAGTSTAYGV
mmetsp:Transcript_51228/g.132998  ORF Transcript_51228/g.132998 Transcript_51228/m.132998 type:complete len:282 (+) Transcript_51228:27-872(+)|eukprot:CAMPEP_0115860110 /NCGR_PEP_ID=MMETSP0287-20121206/16957_1 /TAXON_ID=412157 /ORGANISM="Chrysochromulina rotalis, Strain UIO044" /LENGTH=281 /DNA_ID=CAMNT_0003314421 /DNA_START=24 /DNA_END=869 /DNA_ORIENTATION=-